MGRHYKPFAWEVWVSVGKHKKRLAFGFDISRKIAQETASREMCRKIPKLEAKS
jgi:hypothetical protein